MAAASVTSVTGAEYPSLRPTSHGPGAKRHVALRGRHLPARRSRRNQPGALLGARREQGLVLVGDPAAVVGAQAALK